MGALYATSAGRATTIMTTAIIGGGVTMILLRTGLNFGFFIRQGQERISLHTRKASPVLLISEKRNKQTRQEQAEENGDRDNRHAWNIWGLVNHGPSRPRQNR